MNNYVSFERVRESGLLYSVFDYYHSLLGGEVESTEFVLLKRVVHGVCLLSPGCSKSSRSFLQST